MKYCTNCGNAIPDEAKFCDACGTPAASVVAGSASDSLPRPVAPAVPTSVSTRQDPADLDSAPNAAKGSGRSGKGRGQGQEELSLDNLPEPDGPLYGEHVTLCSDGKYRWVYEMSLLRNPIIFLTILKIFFFIVLGMWVGFSLFEIGPHFFEHFLELGKTMLLVFGIFVGLTLIGCIIYSIMMGGKYVVLFEMDEEGVDHIQVPSQYKKAQVMGLITFLVGANQGNFTAMGAGLLAASKNSSSSQFSVVNSISSHRMWNTIKVNELFSKNQVYVPKEDYDFVLDYIVSRCPNAKVKR